MTRPTMDELRAMMPSNGAKAKGLYAAPPGSGPAGFTCRSCTFLTHTGNDKKHPKCGKVKYTRGDATTIKTSSPACKHYEAQA